MGLLGVGTIGLVSAYWSTNRASAAFVIAVSVVGWIWIVFGLRKQTPSSPRHQPKDQTIPKRRPACDASVDRCLTASQAVDEEPTSPSLHIPGFAAYNLRHETP
jgi:hypothetical protein